MPDLTRIVRNESQAMSRGEALRSYARIRRRVRTEKAGRNRDRELRIFGLNVSYLHADSLLHMAREIYVERQYEFTSAHTDPTVIDAGANIGLATLFFKQKYPSARVIAFEPEPHALAVLKRNIVANQLEDVTLVGRALAGEPGLREMSGWPGSLLTSLQPGRHASGERRMVETVPLSTYIDDHLDFLKLDVEGVESEILDELASAGKLERIRRLVCEYHHHMKDPADRLAHVLQRLEESGFGYQLHAPARTPFEEGVLQNVLIFAYNKTRSSTITTLAAAAYVLLPFDLIPDFTPIVGHFDDAIIVTLAMFAIGRGWPARLLRRLQRTLGKTGLVVAPPSAS